jgi:predicted  nucleic acid-binding Zn-ribbon protein
MLQGCQSSAAGACKDENARLAARVAELENLLEEQRVELEGVGDFIINVVTESQAKDDKIAALEAENRELEARLAAKNPDSARRLIEGVEELRRMQRQAGLKQEPAAEPDKPR